VTDVVQDHPDGVLVMLDEMSLQLQATLSRVWFPVGQRPTIKGSPQRDCLHFFGALALPSGQEIALSQI